jgi:branched-chain amino acid transport system permease protein
VAALRVRERTTSGFWAASGKLGLDRERWTALPVTSKRLVIAAAIGLLSVVVFFPLYGAAVGAFWTFLVFLALYVPPWERVPYVGRLIVPVAVLALVITYPFYWDKLFTIPILGPFPDVHTGVVMLIYVMMAVGLNVVVGYAGLLDLGYVAFYAMGAYTAAWLASVQFAGQHPDFTPKRYFNFGAIGVDKTLGGIHVNPWLILVVAGCTTAVIGILIGFPTLRLRGDYLAIVTLGFGEILPQVFRNGNSLFNTGFNLTNGPQGIGPLDAMGFGDTLHRAVGLPANYQLALTGHASTDNLFFWTAIGLVLLTIFCSLRLRDSRLGRAWIAIREDETAASAMGVPLMRTKTWSYAIGAFVGGVAGAFFAFFVSSANPDSFAFNFSVFVLVMVIVGGMGNVWGVLVGAAFLSYLDQAGLANTGAWLNENVLPCDESQQVIGDVFSHGCIDVPALQFGIYGVMLLLVMLFRPHGLIPEARRKLEFEMGVEDQPLYDVQHGERMIEFEEMEDDE